MLWDYAINIALFGFLYVVAVTIWLAIITHFMHAHFQKIGFMHIKDGALTW